MAPGEYFTASAAMHTPVLRDSSEKYRLFNGTSAATPYAAGVVALVFQQKQDKKEDFTLGQLKDLLRENLTRDDGFTGPTPNPSWGHGKLDYKAVEKVINAARANAPAPRGK